MINPKHSTGYMLFNYKYDFHIPAIHFYSQAYLDFVGVITTGDKGQDRALMNEPIYTRDTIAIMATHFANDVPVRLEKPRDSVEIYEIIKRHLDVWQEALRYEHNIDLPPVEDFQILDEFAASIYEMARRFKPEIRTRVSLSTRLNALRRSMSRQVAQAPAEKGTKRVISHHQSTFNAIDDLYAHRTGEDRGNR